MHYPWYFFYLKRSNTTGVTCAEELAFPSSLLQITSGFRWGLFCMLIRLYVVFYVIVIVVWSVSVFTKTFDLCVWISLWYVSPLFYIHWYLRSYFKLHNIKSNKIYQRIVYFNGHHEECHIRDTYININVTNTSGKKKINKMNRRQVFYWKRVTLKMYENDT